MRLAAQSATQRRIAMYSVELLRQRNNGTRAKQIKFDDGTRVLVSYNTAVAVAKNGNKYRLWDDYSATTMKHLNEFFGCCKKEWDKMPVHRLNEVLSVEQAVITEDVVYHTDCKWAH